MPDEKSAQPPERRKGARHPKPPKSEWIFKPMERGPVRGPEVKIAATAGEQTCRTGESAASRPGPSRMYHPGGRFRDEAGKCFDYLFAELLDDPALPPWVFERVPLLLRGTNDRFHPRRAAREVERIVVGLRYGPGDVPRSLTEH